MGRKSTDEDREEFAFVFCFGCEQIRNFNEEMIIGGLYICPHCSSTTSEADIRAMVMSASDIDQKLDAMDRIEELTELYEKTDSQVVKARCSFELVFWNAVSQAQFLQLSRLGSLGKRKERWEDGNFIVEYE